MSTILGMLTDGLDSIFNQRKIQKYDAQFGRETDIASRWNKGFLISKNRRLTRKQSFQGMLLVANTGAGKTVRVIAPNLLTLKNCSIICNDPAKELHKICATAMSKHFEIKTLNFGDSSISSGYNPLSRIKRSSDINKLSHLLVATTLEKGGSDPFWGLQTQGLLNILIRIVMEQAEEYRNLTNVNFLLSVLSVKPKFLDALVMATNQNQLNLDYKSMMALPERTLMNIVASAKASLSSFNDSEISKVTSNDTIDFSSFRKKPTILFLHNSITDVKYVNSLISVVFEQFLSYILADLPQKEDLDMFLILEEASSLYIPSLPVALANLRKFRVGSIVATQSLSALETFYAKETEALLSNLVTQIFLPGITSMPTLKKLEQISGIGKYIDNEGRTHTKPLLTTDEIRLLNEDESIIVSANYPVIIGKTSPYFRSLKFMKYLNLPPYPLKGEIGEGEVKLIGMK